MDGKETADAAEAFIRRCRQRIEGVGQQQYAQGETQQFETMPLDDLLVYAMEEAEDLANYAFFIWERIRRLRQQRLIKEFRVEKPSITVIDDFKVVKHEDSAD